MERLNDLLLKRNSIHELHENSLTICGFGYETIVHMMSVCLCDTFVFLSSFQLLLSIRDRDLGQIHGES